SEGKGSVTVTTVTLAPRALASASPCATAFPASSDPSVAITRCRYMSAAPSRLVLQSLVAQLHRGVFRQAAEQASQTVCAWVRIVEISWELKFPTTRRLLPP